MTRIWTRLAWTSASVAFVAAAAQLGAGQALGVIDWTTHAKPSAAWHALLSWTGFVHTVAVLAGAAAGRGVLRRPTRPDNLEMRLAAAMLAGLGAAAAGLLSWHSARDTVAAANVDPQLTVALVGGAGIVAGVLLSVLALSAGPIGGNLRAGVAWVWLAAVGGAAVAIISGRPPGPVTVGSGVPVPAWPAAPTIVVVAGVLGAAVAFVARWGGANRLSIAASGAGAPVLIWLSNFLAGPEGAGPQFRGASMIAVLAGLCASAVVAAPRRRMTRVAAPRLSTPARVAAGARSGEPNLATFAASAPAATEPVTVSEPVVAAEAGAPEPDRPEPGLIEPGLIEPGLIEPGPTEPGLIEPGPTELGTAESGGFGAATVTGAEQPAQTPARPDAPRPKPASARQPAAVPKKSPKDSEGTTANKRGRAGKVKSRPAGQRKNGPKHPVRATVDAEYDAWLRSLSQVGAATGRA